MDDRIWRAEQACAAAWPARETVTVGDWRVHRSGGATRRTDSASPGDAAPRLSAADIAAIDAVYEAAGQATIVRVPDFAIGIDPVLDAAGFDPPEGRTRTMLAAPGAVTAGAAVLGEDLDDRWLTARTRMAPRPAPADMRATLARITSPAAFVRREVGGVSAAVACGVIGHGLLVIEAVATDPAYRRTGLARDCVATLTAWARGRGVAEACLQVEADNLAAIGLYDGLGFTTHLYDYHYRRRSR